MSQSSACLELTQVRYALGAAAESAGVREILTGVDITAYAGAVTAIIGPNGAGKTTTLSIAQGLMKPSAGSVQLLGQSPHQAGADLRARVGVMLQDGGLPPSVKPRILLDHIARLHQDPWPVDQLTERLDMGGFLNTAIRRLSGGQRQRVAFAAALLGRPEVVFLDEPTAGLDPQSRQLVFGVITELREAGVAVILTTHHLDEAQKLADAVYILKDGAVVQHGSVGELTGGTTDQGRLAFWTDRDFTRGELESCPHLISRDPHSANRSGTRWVVTGITSPSHLTQLTQWWEQMSVMPTEISFESRTLEDIFWEVSSR